MSEPTEADRATFTLLDAKQNDTQNVIRVHFNPLTLQLSVTNSLQQQGKANETKQQYVATSTSKLTMEACTP